MFFPEAVFSVPPEVHYLELAGDSGEPCAVIGLLRMNRSCEARLENERVQMLVYEAHAVWHVRIRVGMHAVAIPLPAKFRKIELSAYCVQ